MKNDAASDKPNSYYLPNFCTSRAALAIVLIVELTALVITLSRFNDEIGFWLELSRTSMFLIWIGLVGTAALCWSRPFLRSLTASQVSVAVLALIAAVITAISALAWWAGRAYTVEALGIAPLFPRALIDFTLRNVTIAALSSMKRADMMRSPFAMPPTWPTCVYFEPSGSSTQM